MDAARQVLRYLKGNPRQGLLMRNDGDLQVLAYCDYDWGACPLIQHSLTGYFVTLGGSAIFQKTEKQLTISRSSVEAKYHAVTVATSVLIWIRSFLASIRVFVKLLMTLFCDNQATLHIAKNPLFNERTKHIEIDCHFIRECILSKELEICYLALKT